MKRFNVSERHPAGDALGFTLIETIVALFLFTVGILAVASMQTASLNGNNTARETTEAAVVAASVIENLHPLIYATDPALSEGTHVLPNQGPYAPAYTIQRNTMIDNVMLIVVTVNWNEGARPRTINLTYLKNDII